MITNSDSSSTSEGVNQPLKKPIAHEVQVRARQYRLARISEQLRI
jgi:hypothetical protein